MAKRQRGQRNSASPKQRIECFMAALKADEIRNGRKAYQKK